MNKENVGLYDQSFEHDNCGIGAVVNIKGLKTYKTVDDALKIVEQLEHRAGKDAAGETGDGVGILTQIPDEYFQKILGQVRQSIDPSNTIIGEYMCQGKMPQSVRERYVKLKENPEHPANLDALIKNFDCALSHPDSDDLEKLRNLCRLR